MCKRSEFLTKEFNKLTFNESKHKYYVDNNPIKLSVSGIIKKFVKRVDFDAIAKKKDRQLGLPEGTHKAQWDKKRDDSCDKGHNIHEFGELYPFNKRLKPRNKHEEAIVKFWDDIPKHIIPIKMELRMYHKVFLYAGTADIILYDTIKDEYIIGDYKTNIDLFKNFKNKKLLKPFNHLLDNPFNKYQLQLSFYQIMLKQTGVKINKRILIWLLPDATYKMYDTEDLTHTLQEYLENNKL